jgi:hypothetical protein
MSIWFEYHVDGRTYRSSGRAEYVGRSFWAVEAGDQVPIFYDEIDPSFVVMGDPQQYLNDSLLGVAFTFFGLALMAVIYEWRRKGSNTSNRR